MDNSVLTAAMNPNPSPTLGFHGAYSGVTQNDLDQYSHAPDPAQAEAVKHHGNWFTHLLPTIGSVAIPALGALLAPETGGLSLVAAAGLSGLGAAGGKATENAVEGKGVLDGDVLKEGAMGTAGGLAGGVAGKFIGKAAGALGQAGESIATKEATEAAAREGIDTAANTYKDVAPALQKAYKAKDSLAHVTQMGYDIADPENLIHVSNTSNDILNDILNRSLAKGGAVNMNGFNDMVRQAIVDQGGNLGHLDEIALARGRNLSTPASKLLREIQELGAGVVGKQSDPNELRTLTTRLGELAQDSKPTVTAATGAIDPVQKARYTAINAIRDNLKKTLYNRPEVGDALKGEIGNIVANPEQNITQELADHLNGVITKSGSAQDLLDEISRNINISKLGEEGKRVGNIVTSTGGKARAAMEAGLPLETGAGGTGNPMLDIAGNIANPHIGTAKTIVNAAKHAATNPAVLDTMSRIGAMGEKLAPAAGAAIATVPNMQADAVASPMPAGGGYGMFPAGTNDTMGVNMQPSSNQSYIDLMRAKSALAPEHLGGGEATSLMQAMLPTLLKNQLASSAMNSVPASFANAGGAQGTGGIVTKIAGLIPGTAAHTYNAQREAAAAQLAAAMGISPEQAMGMLPDIMQNQGTAGMTQHILANMGGQLAY